MTEAYPGHWQDVLTATNRKAYNQALTDVLYELRSIPNDPASKLEGKVLNLWKLDDKGNW